MYSEGTYIYNEDSDPDVGINEDNQYREPLSWDKFHI